MSDGATGNLASRVLADVCRTRQIDIRPLCGGRVLILSRRGVTVNVYGWDFGVNTATALLVCRNKATCSALLQESGIPCVPHSVFYRPDREAFGFSHEPTWSPMIEYLAAYPQGVVCKPNDLSRGVGVRRVSSATQLEKAVYEIFRYSREVCLSPFVPISAEYRVILFNGVCQLMYVKELSFVIGDGVSMLGELLASTHGKQREDRRLTEILEDIEDTYPVAMIPERGESIRTGWRHNLAHGATARLIDPASPEARPIVDIARRAAHALGVAFSAVDVADIASDLKVLEVNTGIVTNHLLHQVPLAAPIVRDLYATVVEHLFALAEKPESRGTDGGGGAAGIAEPACRSRVM